MAKKKMEYRSEGYDRALNDVGEIADRLIGVGYDQALVDLLRMLRDISDGYGVDFDVNAKDVLEEG